MKKVISGQELQEKIEESIQLLCNTVKQTLGPIGQNVIIDHSSYSPFITNDGVTIAKNIESEDEIIGSILEIAKEASIKTNDMVGDGTTTTLVLLQSLFMESKAVINEGMPPMILKKELEKSLETILKLLQNKILEPTEERIKDMAMIAANDVKLGMLAYDVLKKVKSFSSVTISEIPEDKIEVTYLKGYRFSSQLASFHFLKGNTTLQFHNAFLLLFHETLQDVESISLLLNEVLKEKKEFVIIANDFEDYFVQQILAISKQENLSCALIKILEYGFKTNQVLKDIETITHAKIIESKNYMTGSEIGIIKTITIDKNQTKIDFVPDNKIKKYIASIKQEAKKVEEEFDVSFYQKRIAMFTHGIAQIHLGAPTKIECIEKRMRLEDALCATSVSKKGLLPGGGIAFLQIIDELDLKKESNRIWKKALKSPWEQILSNAGMNHLKLEEKIKKEKNKMIYNVLKEEWEKISHTKVLDSYLVMSNALINACSIVSMLLTTTSLIVNEYKNEMQKENEYTQW